MGASFAADGKVRRANADVLRVIEGENLGIEGFKQILQSVTMGVLGGDA